MRPERLQQGKSRLFPIVGGLLAAYLVFVVAAIALWEDNGNDPDSMDWDDRQVFNVKTISGLEPGLEKAEVLSRLGNPDFTEALEQDGNAIQILRYRTHRTKGDGETTLDETTPLLFRDGVLFAWGDAAFERWKNGG